jgi:hypothetical protein
MSRSEPQHQTLQVRRLRVVEQLLCDGGATVDQLRNAISAAALAGGGGGDEIVSDKTVRRLIGSLEQLGLKVNRTDSPGCLSRFQGVESTRVFR